MTQLSLFDPIEIPLTRGYIAIVDPCDSDLAAYKWFASHPAPYAMRTTGGRDCRKVHLLHRVIMERVIGRNLQSNEQVDHIDNNPLNNSRSNLRVCTPSQNHHNIRRNTKNTSGYKGVSRKRRDGSWQTSITTNGKRIWLGAFDTPEAAYEAYCAAAREYHGEFARVK